MAKIMEYRDIPLDDLVIGKGQVRTTGAGKELDNLMKSIEAQGLLQPIVVCAARDKKKWEILTGQRRFLAHKGLDRKTIAAAVLDERVDEGQAKAISITENLIRRKLTTKELKDGILYLYNLYGSIRDVVETTGLPRSTIQDCVKYPRLLPELKKLVDDGVVDINAAVKAQDASNDDEGNPNPEIAVKLAREMAPMGGAQRKKVVKERKEHPEKPVDEVIEHAKSGAKLIEVRTTITQETHAALRKVAKEEDSLQETAVAMLIEEALISRGLLEE